MCNCEQDAVSDQCVGFVRHCQRDDGLQDALNDAHTPTAPTQAKNKSTHLGASKHMCMPRRVCDDPADGEFTQ